MLNIEKICFSPEEVDELITMSSEGSNISIGLLADPKTSIRLNFTFWDIATFNRFITQLIDFRNVLDAERP